MSTTQGSESTPARTFPRNRKANLGWSFVLSGCVLLAPAAASAQSQRIAPAYPSAGNYAAHPAAVRGPAGYAPSAAPAAPEMTVSAGGNPLGGAPVGAVWHPQAGRTAPLIQQVQNSAESARMAHNLIEAMPTSQEEMEVIERRSQLIITKANVVRMAISDQAILDVVQYSPTEISLIGLGRGSTTMTLWFEGHADPLIYLVKVIRDPNLEDQRRIDYGKLERKLAVLFPNSKVYLIPLSFKIIVRGQARDQEEAANILNIVRGEIINQEGSLFGSGTYSVPNAAYGSSYGGYGGSYFDQVGGAGGGWGNNLGNGLFAGFIVNELRVPGEFQINLRWRVAELNRSQARNLGVDLSVLFNNSRQLITSSMGGIPSTLGGVFENGEIGIFLNWLATNGTAKILTEPNVTVLSGRPARFLSGGEFAVPTVVGIAGAAGQTTTFRGFGTSVVVTPTVVDRDLIRLTTIAEFSQTNAGLTVNSIPGLDTRRVETTVELREGQTFMLGGLLSHTMVTEVSRIPYLGDIPKIGPLLFSNKRSAMDETELLILVTPEIVRPMDAHEVPPVPGFEVTWPQDCEFYKYNMVEGMPDTGYYQVPPYGSGAVGTNVGYQHFNSVPAASMYSPTPTQQGGFTSPTPVPSAPPTEVMPNFGTQNHSPTSYTPPQPSRRTPPPAPPASPTAQRSGRPQGSAQPAGRNIQQAGYTGPRQPAASSQAIVPMNQSAPHAGNAPQGQQNRQGQPSANRY